MIHVNQSERCRHQTTSDGITVSAAETPTRPVIIAFPTSSYPRLGYLIVWTVEAYALPRRMKSLVDQLSLTW